MKSFKKVTCLLFVVFSLGHSHAQEKMFLLVLNGVVIDSKTKEPLVGAGVEIFVDSVKYVGRSTREGGRFDFRGAHLSEAVMRVRNEGYQTKEFPVNKKNNGPYRIKLKRMKAKR